MYLSLRYHEQKLNQLFFARTATKTLPSNNSPEFDASEKANSALSAMVGVNDSIPLALPYIVYS